MKLVSIDCHWIVNIGSGNGLVPRYFHCYTLCTSPLCVRESAPVIIMSPDILTLDSDLHSSVYRQFDFSWDSFPLSDWIIICWLALEYQFQNNKSLCSSMRVNLCHFQTTNVYTLPWEIIYDTFKTTNVYVLPLALETIYATFKTTNIMFIH